MGLFKLFKRAITSLSAYALIAFLVATGAHAAAQNSAVGYDGFLKALAAAIFGLSVLAVVVYLFRSNRSSKTDDNGSS